MTIYNEYTIFDKEMYNKIIETKDVNNVYIAQKTVNKQQFQIVEITDNHVVMNPIIGGDMIESPVVVAITK